MTLLKVFDYYVGQFRYLKYIFFAVLIVLLLAFTFFGYRWYGQRVSEKAHDQLAHAIELFDRAEQEGGQAAWEDVGRAFEQGYLNNASSSLAPYFLAFQSEVAVRVGNIDKARACMTKAVHELSKNSPFYTPYVIKLARMNIDSGDSALVEQGKQSLQLLAQDAENNDRDMALYYQGLIPFEQGDRVAAQKIWDALMKEYDQDSIWSQIAQAKLDYTM